MDTMATGGNPCVRGIHHHQLLVNARAVVSHVCVPGGLLAVQVETLITPRRLPISVLPVVCALLGNVSTLAADFLPSDEQCTPACA
jgi:hypothetical protein